MAEQTTLDETKEAEEAGSEEQEAGKAADEAQAADEAKAKAAADPKAPQPGTGEYSQIVQRRINELTRARRTAERERDKWKTKAETYERKEKAGARPMPPSPDLAVSNPEAYRQEQAKYEDRLHDWRQAQAAPVAPKPSAAEEAPEIPEAVTSFIAQAETLKAQYPDILEVIDRPVFTEGLASALYESERGPEVAYQLGKNPAEAQRIGNLPPAAMNRELGKLEAKLQAVPAPTKRAVSGAPEPITPVKGGAGPSKSPEDMTPEEYRDWRQSQEIERRKRNPFGG